MWLIGAFACQLAVLVTVITVWTRFRSRLAAMLICLFIIGTISRTFIIYFHRGPGEEVFFLQWFALMLGIWLHLSDTKKTDGAPRG